EPYVRSYVTYAYFFAEGRATTPTGTKKHLIVTEIFSYCTPTHDYSNLLAAEGSVLERMMRDRLGAQANVFVNGRAGETTEHAAKEHRQKLINQYVGTTNTTYEIVVYN